MGRFGGGVSASITQDSPSKDSVGYYDNTLLQRSEVYEAKHQSLVFIQKLRHVLAFA